MIITLTVNPAIDRILTVDRLVFEDRAYIRSSSESAGGRGINAAAVIHSFGGSALAVLPSGGASGKRLESYLQCAGYSVLIVPIGNEIRTNLTITDKYGLTVNLNEAGPVIQASELERLEAAVHDQIRNGSAARWLMLCGSTPPGVPSDFYARLIALAHRYEVKTLLDADGDPLREGIEARPTVVSPNQQESERLLNRALLTRTHYLDAAQRIREMGVESVVLSLGSRGAVGAFPSGLVEALPPRIDAVSPIGAGDALAAAFTWAMEHNSDYLDALRWGVATGTASARLPGLQLASLEQAKEIYPQVELRRVE